ncbi:MAG TPA: transposase [Candidatus Babeliaceae bacterium]|nr:transposase [Candidatus Babeliaceae bacterium]
MPVREALKELQKLVKYYNGSKDNVQVLLNPQKKKKYHKCETVDLNLTPDQREIMFIWLEAATEMYNSAVEKIHEIKHCYFRAFNLHQKYNDEKSGDTFLTYERAYNFCRKFKDFRTYYMMERKEEVIKKYSLKLSNYYQPFHGSYIPVHILDCAIQQCCTAFDAMNTSFERGRIKSFTLRKMKFNKVIKLDDIYLSNPKSLFHRVFKNIQATRDNEPYDLTTIVSMSTIRYSEKDDKFYLHVPIKLPVPEKREKNFEYISIDPGVRTPLTGIVKETDAIVSYGEDVREQIYNWYSYVQELKDYGCRKKVVRKWEKKARTKIHNIVENFHWQTCNELTNEAEKIIIGDINVKSIISKKNKTIDPITKKVLVSLRLRGLIDKLKYKCVARNCSLTLVNEAYTSKVCSNCGYFKEDLGGAKEYVCDACPMKKDRDANACINILYKSCVEKYCTKF